MVAAHETEPATNFHFLSVKDLMNNNLFLLDTIVEFGAVPRFPNNLTAAQAEMLRAASGTDIHTNKYRPLTFTLGPDGKFR